MFQRSLTAKILVAVGVTVAIVIAIYTFFVIRVQSVWWHERIQAQNQIAATVIHEYLNGVMLSDRHLEVQRFLMELKSSDEVYRARVTKLDGTVVFSTDTQEVGRVVLPVIHKLLHEGRAVQSVKTENDQRLAIAMRPVANSVSCQRCHDSGNLFNGAIVTERSLRPAELTVATNRNLLIAYGALIFALVGIVLWLLIVRLVSEPVRELLQQMRRVERGDLTARAETERTDEIGELARDFNAMVRSLDTAKRELHESHEKQMQQAGKLATIGELAAGIAHEIRNPLAGIGAAVEVLAEHHPETNREIVQEIQHQTQRLNTTLCDLLDFARFREPEIAPCDLADIVQRMLTLVRPDAQKHHVQIVDELPADLPLLHADATQVQQALLNLFLNGIQAMPNGGTLTVRALTQDNRLSLTIADTGVGIAPEIREKIFSPFFTTKHRGTGLGLAITRTIMEKHRGAISVESELGKGTTFRLDFPIQPPDNFPHATP